jgi:hypothetical protein
MLLILEFPIALITLVLCCSDILLNTLVSDIFSVNSYINFGDQVSNLIKITGKINF